MINWVKLAASVGSATPDPDKGMAAAAPMPPPAVANKPAPGRTGPRGLSPRTTYSRVNTGAPPVPDAGAQGQKSQSPRGLESLPKLAHAKESTSMSETTMFRKPSLQDLVKEAMEGSASKVDISVEAAQQLVNQGGAVSSPVSTPEQTKTASFDLTPNDYIEKLAGALDYLSKEAAGDEAQDGPGKGPNALEVLTPKATGENTFTPNSQGSAPAKDTPPMTPPMQSSGVAKDPSNAMQTNDGMQHPEQPVDPMGNGKTASVYERNLAVLGLSKEAGKIPHGSVQLGNAAKDTGKAAKGVLDNLGDASDKVTSKVTKFVDDVSGKTKDKAYAKGRTRGQDSMSNAFRKADVDKARTDTAKARDTVAKGAVLATGAGAAGAGGGVAVKGAVDKKKSEGGTEKGASVLERNLAALGLAKVAEDAISPAKVSAGTTQTGATPPEGATPSEEGVPSEPSDVTSQKSMISSNDAAINYTKGQANKDPSSDVAKVVPVSASDKTMQMAFANTPKAGVKLSSADMTSVAAAQALLHKFAEAACEKKDAKAKEKKSMMGGLSDPSGQSGFSASSMGG